MGFFDWFARKKKNTEPVAPAEMSTEAPVEAPAHPQVEAASAAMVDTAAQPSGTTGISREVSAVIETTTVTATSSDAVVTVTSTVTTIAATTVPLVEASVEPAQPAAAFAIIDLETTGFSPITDRIVEIGVVRLARDGSRIDTWHSRVQPQIPMRATHIHGITDADVVDAPVFADIAATLSEYVNGLQMVAHNAAFDLGFLKKEFEIAGWDVPALDPFCTLALAKKRYPELHRHTLSICCTHLGIEHANAHSALSDATATSEIFTRFLAHDALSTPGYDAPQWPTAPVRDAQPHPALSAPARSGSPKTTKSTQAATWQGRKTEKVPHEALMQQIKATSLQDIIAAEHIDSARNSYLTVLVQALEDGHLSESEIVELGDLANALELTAEQIANVHAALLFALCLAAYADGKITKIERAELLQIAGAFDLTDADLKKIMREAEHARFMMLSENLAPLPTNWAFGEPLRVGDKVVFTGGEAHTRSGLEAATTAAGVLTMGSVSGVTTLLVHDGEFAGGKSAKAAQHGTRTVTYPEYQELLEHVQPHPKAA